MPSRANFDFKQRPLVVVWEMTQACDLACLHCRADARPLRDPGELTTQEARRFLDQVRVLDPGVLVLSGGDPMKRTDVFELVNYGHRQGIRMAMTPSVTPLLTDEVIRRLAGEGLSRIAFSLDGSCAAVHDSFRGVAGSFDRTLKVMRVAREAGLPVQINTTVSQHNLSDLPALAELLSASEITLWSVFFLVPVGRGQADQRIRPDQYEQVFELLWSIRQRVPFEIKSTEAPHYRRFVLQRLKEGKPTGSDPSSFRYASMNVNDGRGFVFISHTGDVCPSGFLPVPVGNVRSADLGELYRRAPLLVQLRDSDLLGGKCGGCEFRKICGGSRARSWALTGDPLAPEPDCVYEPAALRRKSPPQEGASHVNRSGSRAGADPARTRLYLSDHGQISRRPAHR